MSPQNLTYLITGANRGIGRGLAETFLKRPNTTLIALVRDPTHETSQSLLTSPVGLNSKVVILQYDASQPDSATAAISALRTTHSVNALDVVIANSGFLGYHGPSLSARPADFIAHFTTNTLGPIHLLAATLPLLKASTSRTPTFIAISSAIGSTAWISKHQHVAVVPYGMSKAALNHAMVRISLENPEIVIEMLTPGAVATGLGREMFTEAEIAKRPPNPNRVPYEKSVAGLVHEIDRASKATSGRFFDWKGDEIPW